MKKFESMKVVELKDCARKAGIKGYSRMKKQDLIDALVNAAEVKKNLLNEARTNAHLDYFCILFLKLLSKHREREILKSRHDKALDIFI